MRAAEKLAALFMGAFLLFSLAYSQEQPCVGSIDACIVFIDAGHGGADPGKVGSVYHEADINLGIARRLCSELIARGYIVVCSRTDSGGLSDGAQWSKARDMELRSEMAAACGAAAVLSIHQNSYHDASCRGAQVFYSDRSEANRVFADLMQSRLCEVSPFENHRLALINNEYRMLLASDAPSLIIECGFLSNPAEELLLGTDEYQSALAEAIANGVDEFIRQAKK